MGENEYRIGVLERIVEELIFTVTRLQRCIPWRARQGLTNITSEDIEEIRQQVKEELMNKVKDAPENVLGNAIEETNPCPFCEAKYGRESRQHLPFDREYWHIKCIRCGARGPTENSRADAIAAWNRAAHWEVDEQGFIESLGVKLSQATSLKRMKLLESLADSSRAWLEEFGYCWVCGDPCVRATENGVYEHREDCPIAALDDLERVNE